MKRQPDPVQPIPEGYHSVTPWIISQDTAKLLDFMSKAFGAVELGRVYNEDGTIGHAEAKIGDSIIMAFHARKEWFLPPASCDSTCLMAMRCISKPSQLGRLRSPR